MESANPARFLRELREGVGPATGEAGGSRTRVATPVVFKDAFYVVLVSPPLGGRGTGPDCHLSCGNRGFWAESGPDPGGKPHIYVSFGLKRSWATS